MPSRDPKLYLYDTIADGSTNWRTPTTCAGGSKSFSTSCSPRRISRACRFVTSLDIAMQLLEQTRRQLRASGSTPMRARSPSRDVAAAPPHGCVRQDARSGDAEHRGAGDEGAASPCAVISQ
jgi:hypothetical protein